MKTAQYVKVCELTTKGSIAELPNGLVVIKIRGDKDYYINEDGTIQWR